jgi:hypothetical protein
VGGAARDRHADDGVIRNLATLTRVGLLAPGSEGTRHLVQQLGDVERLRAARIHPIAVLAALKTYAQGKDERGKATWMPAPGAKYIATGFYNLVISTNRCERNHGYVKLRVRPMRGLESFACSMRLFPALDALQLVERDFVQVPPIGAPCTGGRSYVRARHIAAVIIRLGRTL